jgi:hypothetical protein
MLNNTSHFLTSWKVVGKMGKSEFFVETSHVSMQLLSFRENSKNDSLVMISERHKVLGRWKQLQSYSVVVSSKGPNELCYHKRMSL